MTDQKKTYRMASSVHSPNLVQEPVLTADQQHACERLVALARVRASASEAALPVGVLPRWGVPLLVGPAGGGKAFVCEEVARRWGGQPCRRWEVGSWLTHSSRNGLATLEQVQAFILGHPQGCVVYLAGVDALGVQVDYNVSYRMAVESEIAQLLDRATARPARFPAADGTPILQANVLVVTGGCFAPLWGDLATGGPDATEAWKLADKDPLAHPAAVAAWLREHSRLPAGILRRLAPEPLVLRRLDQREAAQLAVRLRDNLPPALDGLSADGFHTALLSPSGWRAVAALIEQAWVDGHDPLVAPPAEAVLTSAQPALPAPPTRTRPAAALPPVRLGERLGLPFTRSRLLADARRHGLHGNQDLEELALARGYGLPGENPAGAMLIERVERLFFGDVELAAALLSPCLEMSERVLCRGARLLAVLLATVHPFAIAEEARRARGATVMRHVAWLAVNIYPQHPRWRALLRELPSVSAIPALVPGVMPDEVLRRVLSTPLP